MSNLEFIVNNFDLVTSRNYNNTTQEKADAPKLEYPSQIKIFLYKNQILIVQFVCHLYHIEVRSRKFLRIL